MLLRRVLHGLIDRHVAVASPPTLAAAACAGAIAAGAGLGLALDGRGPDPVEVVALPAFDSIEVWDLGAPVELNVHANLPARVTLASGSEAVIRTDVRGDTLVISGAAEAPVTVSVALPEVERLVLWGDTRARVRAVHSQELAVTLADTARIEAEGVATRLELVVDAQSQARLGRLSTDVARVTASGGSRVDLSVEQLLSATVGDSAGVYYLGNPQVQQVVHGTGRVTPLAP